MIKKVYRNVTNTMCVILMVDMYVMLCMHVVLFLCMHEGRDRREPVGAKTGYDIVCYNMKEGADESR